MWLGMFAVLPDVFHFSVQVLSVRTRALTKMFLQLLICTLQLQRGNKKKARWTLEDAQKVIIIRCPKQLRNISSMSCIFLTSSSEDMNAWSTISARTFGSVWWLSRWFGLNLLSNFAFIFLLILLKLSEGGGFVTVPCRTCSPSVLKNFQSSSNSVGVGLCQVKWTQREYFRQKL